MFKAMLIYKTRKRLKEEIRELKEKADNLQAKLLKTRNEKDETSLSLYTAQRENERLTQEVTVLKNVIRRQDELLANNKKRIKEMQAIINKQNEQLGFEPKTKARKVEDKEHDPYIEE